MEPNQDNQQNQNADQQDINGNTNDQQQQQNQPSNEMPAWMKVVAEANARARSAEEARLQAEQEAERLRQTQQQSQQQQQVQPIDLINNPDGFRQSIQQDIQRQMAPINAFAANFQRQQNYVTIKNNLKLQNPNLAPLFAQVEAILDARFLNDPNKIPSEAAITQEIKLIIADLWLASGGQQNANQSQQPNNSGNSQQQANNSQQTNQGQNSSMLPPHLRPSNRSAAANNQQRNQQIELSEAERRLAREQGYSPEEYVKMRDAAPHEINRVYSEIIEARKGGK